MDREELKAIRLRQSHGTNLPTTVRAQKEFVRELLSKNQRKFEEVFDELAERDPKRWVELYIDLTKHVIPKQTDVSVSVGISKDFDELKMLGSTFDNATLVDGRPASLLTTAEAINDADFEEMKELDGDAAKIF